MVGYNKKLKSQVEIKTEKYYFKSEEKRKNKTDFHSNMSKFVTKLEIMRSLRCRGDSLKEFFGTCLQMPDLSSS